MLISSDHFSLTWLHREQKSPVLTRLSLFLQDLNILVVPIPGVTNVIPDVLSRNPLVKDIDCYDEDELFHAF